ncbi:MAG: ABC transporter permease [Paramuribaculum sp.]|nr:ABC transporter permease [Paramuribaculum sp.]
MWELINEIAQTLKHNKLRTSLTGFAVAWGIFMLIVLLGMSRGVMNSFNANVDPERSNSMSLWGGMTSKPYKGYKEWRWIRLKGSDMAPIKQYNSEHVAGVSANASLDSAKVSTAKDYLTDGVSGVYPAAKSRYRIKMSHGRFVNDRDLELTRKVMVLHADNASLLFGSPDAAVGKRVDAMGLSWLVVGVYTHDWEKGCYVPFTTAMNLNGFTDYVDEIVVQAKGLETSEDGKNLEDGIRATMARTREFDVEDRGAVHIWNRFEGYLQEKSAMNILNLAVWLIGIFTLLSGIVGVSNIMFVSVRERTHEIGIRRAIGAKPRIILTQIVMESVAVTTLFGYVGVFLGMVVMQVIDSLFGNTDFLKNPTVDLYMALEVTLVLIVAGAFAGLFPAIKATKVKPVEALRDE